MFRRLGSTLEEAGGTLADMVTMTVFVTDLRNGTRFTELRREILGDDFPASALITCAGARPAGVAGRGPGHRRHRLIASAPVARLIHQRLLLAAVDLDLRAVDEVRQRRGEHGDEIGDLARLGDAAQGMLRGASPSAVS